MALLLEAGTMPENRRKRDKTETQLEDTENYFKRLKLKRERQTLHTVMEKCGHVL
jgi:hypothetical protein